MDVKERIGPDDKRKKVRNILLSPTACYIGNTIK